MSSLTLKWIPSINTFVLRSVEVKNKHIYVWHFPYKWVLDLLLTLDSSSFSMSSLDEENSLRVIFAVLSPWPTEPIISCSFSWLPSAYMLIQGIFLTIYKKWKMSHGPAKSSNSGLGQQRGGNIWIHKILHRIFIKSLSNLFLIYFLLGGINCSVLSTEIFLGEKMHPL